MRKTTSVDFYPDLTSSDPLNFFVSFLINLASNDATFGTQLFWYLRVSSRSVKDKSDNSFAKLQGIFLGALAQTKEGSEMAANLYSQVELFAKFENLMKIIKRQKVSREQKQEMIVNFLDDPNNGLMSFKHISLPINPNIIVSGILADRCTLFKSNALPVKIHFIASHKETPDDIHIFPVLTCIDIFSLFDRSYSRKAMTCGRIN